MCSIRYFKFSAGLIALWLILIQIASAHPGHDSFSLPPESVAHYAFEPVHLLPALGAGLVLLFAIRWVGNCRWRQRFER